MFLKIWKMQFTVFTGNEDRLGWHRSFTWGMQNNPESNWKLQTLERHLFDSGEHYSIQTQVTPTFSFNPSNTFARSSLFCRWSPAYFSSFPSFSTRSINHPLNNTSSFWSGCTYTYAGCSARYRILLIWQWLATICSELSSPPSHIGQVQPWEPCREMKM